MRHLTDIDAELGLAPYDNFSDADGRGAAKAALAAGLAACQLKHPFSKSKRNACREEKQRLYAAKIAAIDGIVGSQYSTAPVATGTAIKPKPVSQTKELPKEMPESPASARLTVAERPEETTNGAEGDVSESGMSMNTKILIGVGAAVLLIGGYMYMKKK